ncbi:MAG: glycosyltransferase [Bacteroides sp.]|nr:glycosyltransferase [Bacteroides sp.]MCM1413236.1 glycosyltransferase [Bacteroides sp.]MCM1471454.1 glycosyltransferase [Bacteroides sp.]
MHKDIIDTQTIPPRISIIVPVYNVERYLRECVDSILCQTMADFELIMVDDGSSDSSPAICDEYAARDPRVRVIHQANAGVSAARNAGLDAARGEWISFVDADDWIEPEMLEELLSQAEREGADIAYCDFNFIYEDGRKEQYSTCNLSGKGHKVVAEYISTQWTVLWNSIQRRSLFTDHGLRCPVGIIFCEDFHLSVRCMFHAQKIVKVNRHLYNYVQRESSICHNYDDAANSAAVWVYEDTIRYFKKHNVFSKDIRKAMAWRMLVTTQQLALDSSKFDEFIQLNKDSKKSILSHPTLGTKMKIIQWCLTHHLRSAAWMIVKLRKLLGR